MDNGNPNSWLDKFCIQHYYWKETSYEKQSAVPK